MISRVVLIVMDSVGCGELPDAAAYGDEGSDTLGHIADAVPLKVPTLRSLGLGRVARIGGDGPAPRGAAGRMAEASPGKDSVTGHWELMGIVLDHPFPTFPSGFSKETIAEFEHRIGRTTIGNVVASGTTIINELGPEHLRTGAPIVYTSADSVFQIAAHERIVPIDELYRYCDAAFDLVGRGMGVGRVIARPFVGEPGSFVRTSNRRDYALDPFGHTLLDTLKAARYPVVGIGKIEDLFAGRGLTKAIHTTSDDHGMDVVLEELGTTERGLIFVNLVDFDTLYGHRNDVAGYAANLERFDVRLAEVMLRLTESDLLIVTADHGNDPATPSTDHAREYVPLLVAGATVTPGVDVGTRATFADLGQTVAEIFGVPPLPHGESFARLIF
ncbi:MAG: phosphopentomutase [Acidobacteria bacterium]|jgi:phosphopentomutase|nr:phosphopentomutase [Acidobacteriota bacterium]